MSAIAGIYQFNRESVSTEQRGEIMNALQKYPADDVQTWQIENGHIFLGCHAQWITPESVGERLPFYDPESRLAITADAIIDNRDELFDRLQVERTYRKRMTDSELILRAYQKWGEDSPKYLVGDFAYMIWDEREQRLFGARDFSGARPLYYYHDGQRFAFCTVIHPLLTLPYTKMALNEVWLAENLAISGMIDTVCASITPYQQIEQVPPAHAVTIKSGQVKLARYCTLTPGKRLKLKSDEEYIEAFQEVFQKAVNSRLRTRLNAGSQLSGGLDSGAVVAFAAKELMKENKKLHTFSYIPPNDFKDFTSKRFLADERPFIQSTVNYIGGIEDHYLAFEGKSSYSEIDDILEIMEMPYKFFENSFWIKGMFEKAEDKGIGVLLNGDRGNFTISWGFAMDYYASLLKKLKWIRLIQELNQYSRKAGGARLRRLPTVARVAFPFLNPIFSNGTSYKLPRIINDEFAKRTGVYEKIKSRGLDEDGWLSVSSTHKERKLLFEKLFPWNTGNTLTAKLSLRHSLWKRDPTNDLRVYRFCFSVPDEQYVQNGLDRALIRRATKNHLPDKVRLNQKIRGVQGVDWVHRMIPAWEEFIEDLRQLNLDQEISEFINMKAIKTAIKKVEEGPRTEFFTDPDYRILMRCVIIHRFMKKFA